MDLLTPKGLDVEPGTEIVRADGTWWRVLWAEDADRPDSINIIAGQEPELIATILDAQTLVPWRAPSQEIWDFVVEELMELPA